MDLNYARDTTSGREGLDLLEHIANSGWRASDRGYDGLGDRGSGRRGDATRRRRFRRKALGQCPGCWKFCKKQIDLGRERREARRRSPRRKSRRARNEVAQHFHEQRTRDGEKPARSSKDFCRNRNSASARAIEICGSMAAGTHRRRRLLRRSSVRRRIAWASASRTWREKACRRRC